MIKFLKRRKQLKQINSDINTLCLYKKTLKDVVSFSSGLEYLNEQFDMTEYAINNLNRSLTSYLGQQDCLYECLNLLHSCQDMYIKERNTKTVEFNKLNNLRKAQGLETCLLTTDTEEFIYKYHRLINQIQEATHNTVINHLTNFKNKKQDTSHIAYLDRKEVETLNKNSNLYGQIFTLENVLRKYILLKYKNKHNDESLRDWLKQGQLDDYSTKKGEENRFGISSRGDNVVYYLDFNDLGAIIQTNFKEGFNLDFKRVDDIVPKLNYLYLVRCKIAHNSLCITSDEIKMAEVYVFYILRIVYRKIIH